MIDLDQLPKLICLSISQYLLKHCELSLPVVDFTEDDVVEILVEQSDVVDELLLVQVV